MKTYTVTFKSGKTDSFRSHSRDWIGCALGRNQSETLQTIVDVSAK